MNPFYGEFLLQIAPVESSLSLCSNGCHYCFVYKLKPETIPTLARSIATGRTFAARLVRDGYPLLLSNRSDPFCESNTSDTIQVLRVLRAVNGKVCFQTKCGPGMIEAADIIGPSCWYVTITTMDDDICRRIEPGAPVTSERLRLIAQLQKCGHHVWVGVNPLERRWIGNPTDFICRLRDSGIRHVWGEVLHFSRDLKARLSDASRGALGADVIQEARSSKYAEAAVVFAVNFAHECKDQGVDFACKLWPNPSHVLDPYVALYSRRFPTMTEFTTWAWENLRPGDQIPFSSWADYMLKRLPDYTDSRTGMQHYCCVGNRRLAKRLQFDGVIGWRDVLLLIWTQRAMPMNPSRSYAFKIMRDASGDEILDADGLPIRYFTGKKL